MGVVVGKLVFREFSADLEPFFYSQIQANENLNNIIHNAVQTNDFMSEGDYTDIDSIVLSVKLFARCQYPHSRFIIYGRLLQWKTLAKS
jgi:hypothetical protein